VLQCVAVCCSVLQCVAVCGSVLQRVAVCCSVLQFVAMRCYMLLCVRCTHDIPSSRRVAVSPYIRVPLDLEVQANGYGVATVSSIDKILGLFCIIAFLLQGSFAKETSIFIDFTNPSHPIRVNCILWHYVMSPIDVWQRRSLLQKRPIIYRSY